MKRRRALLGLLLVAHATPARAQEIERDGHAIIFEEEIELTTVDAGRVVLATSIVAEQTEAVSPRVAARAGALVARLTRDADDVLVDLIAAWEHGSWEIGVEVSNLDDPDGREVLATLGYRFGS